MKPKWDVAPKGSAYGLYRIRLKYSTPVAYPDGLFTEVRQLVCIGPRSDIVELKNRMTEFYARLDKLS